MLLRRYRTVEAIFTAGHTPKATNVGAAIQGFSVRMMSALAVMPHPVCGSILRAPLPGVQPNGCACICAGWYDRAQSIWDSGNAITPRQLVLPLDVHSGRQARQLGVLDRQSDDWRAAMELTTACRTLCPEDPARYDYAFFGLGVNGRPTGSRDAAHSGRVMERPEHPTLGIIIPVHNEEPVLPQLLSTFGGGGILGCRLQCYSLTMAAKTDPWAFFRNPAARTRTTRALACPETSDTTLQSRQGYVTAGEMPLRCWTRICKTRPNWSLTSSKKWREGYDVVYGIRQDRKESLPLRFAYWAFYFLLNRVANVHIPRDAGLFALMDRRVVAVLNEMPEHNRYLPGLRGWAGFKQTGIPYSRPARQAGETSWNVRRLTAFGA